ncbi:MAG TPA: cyanophycin synthetase, partial [Nitrosomonas sp.]|nr:cyanophycin synthetase [Nitrosomonas sp.]
IKHVGSQMKFTAIIGVNGTARNIDILLNIPGLHNVQNALAAIAIANEIGVADSAIIKALAEFRGVGRRFQQYGEIQLPASGSFLLIDDYGHHPAEMEATMKAARGAFPDRRLVVVFQPHRYTRTRDLFEDFVRVLSQADVLLLTEIYSAGEEFIVAADSKSLARSIRVLGKVEPIYVEEVDGLKDAIIDVAQDGDVVLVMGAGSIAKIPPVLARMKNKLLVVNGNHG